MKRGVFGRTFNLLLCTLLCSGCSEDLYETYIQEKNLVEFDVTTEQDWSYVSENQLSHQNIPIEGYNDSKLYLGTEIINGISGHNETEDASTRSATISANNFYSSFGVYSFAYDGAWDAGICKPNLMSNLKITKSGGTVWKPAYTYYWPESSLKKRFFAYAPYNEDATQFAENVLSVSNSSNAGFPNLTYTVPSSTSDQRDLMAAVTSEMTEVPSAPIGLDFKHILTAIKFKVGGNMLNGTISRIALKGVKGVGTFTFSSDANEVGSWDSDVSSGKKKDFTQELSFTINNNANASITTEDQTFMMIPQTLPDGARIEVGFTDALTGTFFTLSAAIDGGQWRKGQTVTYVLSTTSIDVEYHLTATSPTANNTEGVAYEHSGGVKQVTISSYVTVSNGSTTGNAPIGWKITGYLEGDELGTVFDETKWTTTQPNWLSIIENASGSISPAGYSLTLKSGIFNSLSSHTATLANASAKGTAGNYYDLSTNALANANSSAINTANCYVVDAPGYYQIPLVYGNALKGGVANTQAYNPGNHSTTHLGTFVNHLDNGITNPYIYNNTGCGTDNIKDACIVWQDVYNLVSDVHLSSDKHYLQFQIVKENITQGNSVIAIRDNNGNVMWSWHIWVTDESLGTTNLRKIKSKSGSNMVYQFLNFNLGSTDEDTRTYKGRSVKIKIEQVEGNASPAIITIYQNSKEGVSYISGSPFYQWGRKDPLLPVNSWAHIDKPVFNNTYAWTCIQAFTEEDINYTIDGTNSDGTPKKVYGTMKIGNGIHISDVIQHPFTFYYAPYIPGYETWTTYNYLNLWNTAQTSGKSSDISTNGINHVKSIYDPAPYGFRVASADAYSGLMNTYTVVYKDHNYSSVGTLNEDGRYIDFNTEETGKKLRLRATGYRGGRSTQGGNGGSYYHDGNFDFYYKAADGSESRNFSAFWGYAARGDGNQMAWMYDGWRSDGFQLMIIKDE